MFSLALYSVEILYHSWIEILEYSCIVPLSLEVVFDDLRIWVSFLFLFFLSTIRCDLCTGNRFSLLRRGRFMSAKQREKKQTRHDDTILTQLHFTSKSIRLSFSQSTSATESQEIRLNNGYNCFHWPHINTDEKWKIEKYQIHLLF